MADEEKKETAKKAAPKKAAAPRRTARTTKAKARIERFHQLEQGRLVIDDSEIEMSSAASRLGKKVIELKNISKAYGGKLLIDNFTYTVLRNDRIGILGENGSGKSTMLKLLCGELEPDSGTVDTGETVKIGYFSQENEHMDKSRRVIEYVCDIAHNVKTADGYISASQMLERFLFPPHMHSVPVGRLSGGEQRRLYLLGILMSAPNVLILDEPTNDLDIATLQVLESFLDTFMGIVIVVSHDRYFLERIADRIAAFEDGQIRIYEGGYMDYLEKKKEFGVSEDELSHVDSGSRIHKKKDNSAKEGDNTRRKGSYRDPVTKKLRFTYMEQKEFDTIDEDIAVLEEKIEILEKEISQNATDFVKLNELVKEKEEAETALEEKMDRWVYLNDLAEKIKQQKNENSL